MERIYINVNYKTNAKSLCKKVEKVIIDRLVDSDSRYYLIKNMWNCYYYKNTNEDRLNEINRFLRRHNIILIIKN